MGTASGSDAGRLSEKREDYGEKKGAVAFKSSAEDQLPPYMDHLDVAETESIHHPADKDDILTHTIYVEDDPTLNALTFRTFFLGMLYHLDTPIIASNTHSTFFTLQQLLSREPHRPNFQDLV